MPSSRVVAGLQRAASFPLQEFQKELAAGDGEEKKEGTTQKVTQKVKDPAAGEGASARDIE